MIEFIINTYNYESKPKMQKSQKTMKTDYYELLAVAKDATQKDIEKVIIICALYHYCTLGV